MTSNPIARIGRKEFVALMAMLAATVAFSIDAMLPALSEMGVVLSPEDPTRASLVITSFVFGMGLGTMFSGPLSDAFGRRPVLMVGAAIYIVAALLAGLAQSLDTMLAARFVQGLGAAGPRIVAMAVIRDRYEGRDMARLVSFVMVVFTLVPVLAPTLGAFLIELTGWRGIFVAFALFSLLTVLWFALRQPETLTADRRRPFTATLLWAGLRELWGIEMVRLSILVQTLTFGMLFSILSATQLIFDQTFGRAESFHLWFGAIALVAGSAGFLNARLVMHFGMRAIVLAMMLVSVSVSVICALLWLTSPSENVYFASFVIWQTMLFFQAGMTIGNLNALAMEPVGHIAGLAASLIGAVATAGAAMISIPVALSFDGTPIPLAFWMAALAAVAVLLALRMRRLEREPTPN